MTKRELEAIIVELVRRKNGASDAELAMLNRALNGLRYKYEKAGGIWEHYDLDWGATPP